MYAGTFCYYYTGCGIGTKRKRTFALWLKLAEYDSDEVGDNRRESSDHASMEHSMETGNGPLSQELVSLCREGDTSPDSTKAGGSGYNAWSGRRMANTLKDLGPDGIMEPVCG
jgi:hypothetical protein